MQRSFKVHFRLVVLGWLRKSEGCSIGLLRLREVLSRESNHLRRPHFFALLCTVGWHAYGAPTSAAPRQNLLRHLNCFAIKQNEKFSYKQVRLFFSFYFSCLATDKCREQRLRSVCVRARKSEGCSIGLLRLREVLSRESNHLRRPHFFCPVVNGWAKK